MEITYSEMFLSVVALIFAVLYVREKHEHGFFKFKTAIIMKAIAEGKAKFVRNGDDFEIVKAEE